MQWTYHSFGSISKYVPILPRALKINNSPAKLSILSTTDS